MRQQPGTEHSATGLEGKRRTWALRCTGPLSILPLGLLTFLLFGTYDSADIGHEQSIPLFLQGSTDLFGSCLFAATMASYLVLGLSASLYLTLRLAEEAPATNAVTDIGRGLWHLKYHIACFLIFGQYPIQSFDSRIGPNDFRNIFLLTALLYAGSFLLILWLYRRGFRFEARLALAPTLLILWLIVGSDGTTAKAGQVLYSGEDPEIKPRGLRHGLMLEWHRLCDNLWGDIR